MKLDDKLLVSGTPLVQGVFPFIVEVVDARGRSDTANLVLDVRPPAIQVKGDVPDRVVPNQRVQVQFTIIGPTPDQVTWVVRDGALPKGLSMDQSGLLQGTVAADAELGPYTFTVSPSADGRELTFASYSMDVVSKIDAKRGCGCSGAEGLGVVGLLALLARRRRARQRPASRGS
jgi:uncharacterized protein (TIGR03382 family)